MIEIVEARLEHCIDIVQRLRPFEREALEKLGVVPERFMVEQVTNSIMAWAGLKDGACGAIWGIRTAGILSDECWIWLTGTELINENRMAVLRHSIPVVNHFRSMFRVVQGYVLCDFDCSIKWLRWLGFELNEPVNG